MVSSNKKPRKGVAQPRQSFGARALERRACAGIVDRAAGEKTSERAREERRRI